MKYLLVVMLLCVVSTIQADTIYLVRHAEKVEDGSKDPVLTAAGQQRAENIANMLSHANIQHVYATDYQRTQLTAKPLADYLGTAVTSYDPRQLPAFAEVLKQQSGNALIVGHSNTTPMLTYLLSGTPVMGLDEVDFDNIYQVNIDADKTTLNHLKSLPSQATQTLSQVNPVEANFFNGQLRFNMLFKDEVVGTSVHSFKQVDQNYELTEKTLIETMNIDAEIKTTVDSKTLAPGQMNMTGTMGTPVEIKLQWLNHVVKGHSEMARAPFKAQGKLEIDTTLHPMSLERTSAIMLAHLMPVNTTQPLLINWFNGYDGDKRLINILYHGEEQITVPAGTFETYKIEYSGGAPSQYYWIDKAQAKVVKIEVIKAPWKYELVEFDLES